MAMPLNTSTEKYMRRNIKLTTFVWCLIFCVKALLVNCMLPPVQKEVKSSKLLLELKDLSYLLPIPWRCIADLLS